VCAEIPLFFYVAEITAAKMLLFFRELAAVGFLNIREGFSVPCGGGAQGKRNLKKILQENGA